MTNRADIDAVVSEAREAFERLRGVAVADHPKPAPKPKPMPTLPDTAPPKLTAPPAPDREARRAELLRQRPPAHYLAGPTEDFRRYVTPDGVTPGGIGLGGVYWGPV